MCYSWSIKSIHSSKSIAIFMQYSNDFLIVLLSAVWLLVASLRNLWFNCCLSFSSGSLNCWSLIRVGLGARFHCASQACRHTHKIIKLRSNFHSCDIGLRGPVRGANCSIIILFAPDRLILFYTALADACYFVHVFLFPENRAFYWDNLSFI